MVAGNGSFVCFETFHMVWFSWSPNLCPLIKWRYLTIVCTNHNTLDKGGRIQGVGSVPFPACPVILHLPGEYKLLLPAGQNDTGNGLELFPAHMECHRRATSYGTQKLYVSKVKKFTSNAICM